MPTRTSASGAQDPNEKAKNDAEEALALWWAEQLQLQYYDLLDLLKKAVRMPSADWWMGWANIFTAFMVPQLSGMVETSALAMMNSLGVGVEWDLILAESSNWASSYAFSLISDINQRTMTRLQSVFQDYFRLDEPGMDYLAESLSSLFSPVRAEMIAVTETTRGFERGQDIYEEQLKKQGIATDRLWHTMQDAGVCPICEPNDEKLRDRDGWTVPGLPVHPRDRCWTEVVMV